MSQRKIKKPKPRAKPPKPKAPPPSTWALVIRHAIRQCLANNTLELDRLWDYDYLTEFSEWIGFPKSAVFKQAEVLRARMVRSRLKEIRNDQTDQT